MTLMLLGNRASTKESARVSSYLATERWPQLVDYVDSAPEVFRLKQSLW